MALVRSDLDTGAGCLVISYGVTARAARQAVAKLRAEGLRTSFLHIQSLFPIPQKWLEQAVAGVDAVFVAEENLTGQYRTVLTPYLSGKRIFGINRIGRLISPHDIASAVKGVMA
jgi:2-oxoglutarate ferredoxin oxidoreductase subunit alpha